MRSVYLRTLFPGLAALGAVYGTISRTFENEAFSSGRARWNEDSRRQDCRRHCTRGLATGDHL
ncbi:hypothetical protein HALLA_05595 [Halostagnicola larsenii XH-48]|uniref:Uncharacterized protein n=1 Tax=Halostagnicola larsenii XH-48 TaxID=797299 RepID=W0JQ28_9EURY|nr:hypothetical protein [Halostagnicola larsenii]AHG00714.1 hypothetical protein HALLA_05595 [Halostagnicola larsenii XH-48]